MPVNENEAVDLANLAIAVRMHRALSRWDHAGVVANIRKLAHLELPDVAMAVIRAAADPDARTPGVIPKLDAPHWRERITDPERPRPIPRDDWCRDCGRHRMDPIHRFPASVSADDDMGHHPFVHVDAPAGDTPPPNLRQIVADARVVCETPIDDQRTTEETQ